MEAFDVLGDPVRRRILELLADGEASSGQLTATVRAEFGISQPAVSQHLKVLRDNGFATVRAEGTRRLYAVEPAAMREVDDWLDRFRRAWQPRLDALGTEIARGKRRRARQSTTRAALDRAPTTRREGPQMSESNTTINSSVDVDAHAQSVRREVAYGEGDLRVATISQVYPTNAEDLWEACTVADRLARWFAPVTGDLRLGGRYAVQGNASGTVESCDPPRSYGITWEFGGDVSWVTVTVAPEGGGARFTLEHRAHVDDERWGEYGPGAVGVGWDLALLGLANHITDPSATAIDPEAWGATDEARRFITAASAGWARASIAAGTPTEAAEAARDRTSAFYTGG